MDPSQQLSLLGYCQGSNGEHHCSGASWVFPSFPNVPTAQQHGRPSFPVPPFYRWGN